MLENELRQNGRGGLVPGAIVAHGPAKPISAMVEDTCRCPRAQIIADIRARSSILLGKKVGWGESCLCSPTEPPLASRD